VQKEVTAARNYGNPFGPKNDTYQVAKFQLTEPISKPRFKPSFKPRSYRRAPPCSCNDPSTTWRSCINAPSSPSPIELSNGSARHTPALVDIHSTSDNRLKRLRSCIDKYWSRRQSSPLVDTRPTSNSPSMRSPRSSILSDNTLSPIRSGERSVRQPSAFVHTHSTSNSFSERRRSRSNASSNFPSMLSGYGSARPSSPRGDTRPTSNISSRRSPHSGILSNDTLPSRRSGRGSVRQPSAFVDTRPLPNTFSTASLRLPSAAFDRFLPIPVDERSARQPLASVDNRSRSNNSVTPTMRPGFPSHNTLHPIISNEEKENSIPGSKRDSKSDLNNDSKKRCLYINSILNSDMP
jgi:hypothetical protein